MNWKKIVKRILSPIRCFLFRIKDHGKDVYFGKGTKVYGPHGCHIGNNVSVMPYTMLMCLRPESVLSLEDGCSLGMFSRISCNFAITLEKDVLLGPSVFISDVNHEYQDPNVAINRQGVFAKPTAEFPRGGVRIGEGSWLGTHVVVAGSVSIGKHCVIGANSVVTHSIPDYCVAAGIPCKVIKKYNFTTNKWERV